MFFFSLSLSLCSYNYPNPAPLSLATVFFPSFFSTLPYLLRTWQCVSSYQSSLHPHHLVNAAKYVASIVPVVVSALQHYGNATSTSSQPSNYLESTLIISLVVSTSFSLSWDILMDWGFFGKQLDSCRLLRPSRFGPELSLLALLLNSSLRFGWMLRFYRASLFTSDDQYVMAIEFLEVLRRSVWNLWRVDWQLVCVADAAKEEGEARGQTRGQKKGEVEMTEAVMEGAEMGDKGRRKTGGEKVYEIRPNV